MDGDYQPDNSHAIVLPGAGVDAEDDWYELAPQPVSRRGRSLSQRSSHSGSRGRHRRAKKSAWQKFKDLLRSFFAFVFSSVGICVLVNVYLFLGAYAFMELEHPAEIGTRFRVAEYRNSTVDRLWAVTDKFNTLHKANWTEAVRKEVRAFQEHIIGQIGDGYAGLDVPVPKWSYSGSLLYAITVITTIGKKFVARTDEQKKPSLPGNGHWARPGVLQRNRSLQQRGEGGEE